MSAREYYHLSSIDTAAGGNVIQNLAYSDDADGNVQTITDNLNGSRSQSFGYDDLNRLASASGLYGSQSYEYDGVGNRSTMTIGGVQYIYTASSTSNQIVSITRTGGGRYFYYQPAGQVYSDQRSPSSDYTFGYDGFGHLTGASLNGSSLATYIYNGFDQRAVKAAATTMDYLYDRAGHLIAEASDATGTMIREYIWMDNTPVAMVDDTGANPVVYDIQSDHLGRPQKLTDQSANLVWDGAFDPFGNPASITGSVTMLLMFPGQYYDSETQLSQNWHRDYDPSIGRYVESDPIGLMGGINTYNYVDENPLRFSDSAGEFDPLTFEEATEYALDVELMGGGPEDPISDTVAAALLLGGGIEAALSNPPGQNGSTSRCSSKNDCIEECYPILERAVRFPETI